MRRQTAVSTAVDELVAASDRRAELEATLGTGGYAVVVDGPEQAAAVVDVVAPEHLELMVSETDAEAILAAAPAAGAIFVGPVVAGQRGGLPGRAQPCPADQPDSPVRQRPPGRRLPPPRACRDRR